MVPPAEAIRCAKCRHSNAPGAARCAVCNNLLSGEDLTITEAGWSVAARSIVPASIQALQEGTVLSARYQILQLLGEGGMGTVYRAKDLELDRFVAVKVIRGDLSHQPKILQRFKQELILARQVTHKNVIRIFDLGSHEGLKYITMEYVDGRDLSSLLDERRFAPDDAARIIRQVCRALEAAHGENVIHRDLKPQNVMIDESGRVRVMDFGLARSVETSGLTQTGAMLGTPAYMSPEQAKGVPLDARSDLFSLGIMFYAMLTGQVPFKADTALASLLKRTQEPPPAPIVVSPEVPQPLSDIVMKCLAIDPGQRYQSAAEVAADLDIWLGDAPGSIVAIVPPTVAEAPPAARTRPKWVMPAVAAAATLIAVAGMLAIRAKWFSHPAVRPETVSVLVADFKNNTSDPVFNGTLEPAFTVALEGASFITAYSRSDARRIGAQLQPGAPRLDESIARLVAVRQGISVVVAGSISSESSGYEIALRAVDAFTGKTITTESVKGTGKEGVLSATVKMAARLRNALGDDTPQALQMAGAETFTAASLEAAHAYAEGEQLERAGKRQEAIAAYLKAVDLDPNLGRAYASLAAVYSDLGQLDETEKYHKQAMARIDRMSDREKYKTRGIYYLAVQRNHQKAIEELSALVRQYPADAGGLKNLALAYFFARDLPHALEIGRRATRIYPKNVIGRNNVALYAMYDGDFQTSASEAKQVIEMSPSFVRAYLALALSELAQGRDEQAAAAYSRMEGIDAQGASLAATGLADLAMYEGRLADAQAILQKGIEADSNNPSAAANKLTMLAEVQLMRGQASAALASADRALSLNSAESIAFPAARIYVQAGREAKAEELATGLSKKLGSEPQLYAKLIQGEVLLKRGKIREALQTFQDAQKTADAWLVHFDLASTYLEAKAPTEAYAEFDTCIKRRGEATAVFLDDVPSYRYFPPVYYYLGLTQDALNSPAAAQSFHTLLSIKEKGAGDPMAEKARKRLDPAK